MKKLTAEKCRKEIEWVKSSHEEGMVTELTLLLLQALEIALPILEQQERGDVPERQDSLKHVGYLFVNSGGGVVYSPSGFGMRGFTCAGKIYGDVSFQQEKQEMITDSDEQGEGWIEWDGKCGGNDQPVTGMVEVKFRDGDTQKSEASDWYWPHDGIESDIIAYRIIPEQPTHQKGG